MKTIVKALVAVLVLAAVAGGAAVYYLDGLVEAAIERGASYALGVPARVEGVHLAPVRGSFELSGLEVDNPEGFERPRFLGLRSARLELPPRRLLDSTVRVPLLALEGIEVDLERSGSASNYGKILDHLGRFESAQPAAGAQGGQEKAGKRFIVERLVVRDVSAHLALSVGGVAKPKATITIPEISLHDVGAKEGGVGIGELASIVTKAVLTSVSRAGGVPLELARDLGGQLKGLAKVTVELPPGIDRVTKGLTGLDKGVLGAGASGAAKKGTGQVEKALKGLGGLLGGKGK